MKRFSFLLLVLMLAQDLAEAEQVGFLHAKGARILNGQEQEIILRGMGLKEEVIKRNYNPKALALFTG